MKKNWKLRGCGLLMALVLAMTQCLPVYAVGADSALLPEDGTAVSEPAADSAAVPDADSTETPAADSAAVPDADSAETPDADSTETPDADSAETPDADSAETPDADSTETPDADSTETPGEDGAPGFVMKPAAGGEGEPADAAPKAADTSWVHPAALAGGWYEDFEETHTTTHADTAKYWKDGVIPVALDHNSIWPSTVSENVSFAVEEADAGNHVVHVSSTNPTGRADFYLEFKNVDYTKDYILRARVKTNNVAMKAAFLRAQVGDKINKPLANTTFEGTKDWYTFDLRLENLQAVGQLASGTTGGMKVEIYPDNMTGDIWIDQLQLIPADASFGLDRKTASLRMGETLQLTATNAPQGATVTWTSSNEAVATVSASGLVTAVKNGTATITATLGEETAECAVTVSEEEVIWSNGFEETVDSTDTKHWPDSKSAKGFNSIGWSGNAFATGSLFKVDTAVKHGGNSSLYYESTADTNKKSLSATTTIDYTKDYVLRAWIKGEDIVKQGNSGWRGPILRVQIGNAEIFAVGNDLRKAGTYDWTQIELPMADIETAVEAYNKANPSKPQITLSGGTCQITIELVFETFKGKFWADDLELIVDHSYSVALDEKAVSLPMGDTKQLTVEATGEVPAGVAYTWKSSDEAVATVSATGLVTGVAGGKATITVSADDTHTASCVVMVVDPEMEAAFGAMREKWTDRLTGNPYWAGAGTSEDYKTILAGYETAAETALAHLKTDSATVLFDDLDLDISKKLGSTSTNSGDSVMYSDAISRIQDLARVWAAEGSKYYHDDGLKTKILYALAWAEEHFYNAELNNQEMFGNWYHWWIGMPQNLAGAVILMHDELSDELLAKEAAVLEHFNEDPSYVYKVKGAKGKMDMVSGNLADTSLASLLRGAACSDPVAVVNGTKYFDRIAGVVTSGEGIYADGSFIQHTNLAYTGGYGSTLLNGVEKLVYLSTGTPWEIEADMLNDVFGWIWNGIRPLYANGAMFDMVSGRGIARPSSADVKTGRGILAAVSLLAGSAPAEYKAKIQSFAKAQLQAGAKTMGDAEYFGGMNAAAMMAARALVNDSSIEAAPNKGYAHVFGAMDKAVAHSTRFSFGISYASARTGRFEFGNEENKLGWHQSDGATYLYNGDANQYADNYWNTVDPQRLAGITTDHSTWTLKNWGNYPGNANFNGGSTVGPYASVVMNFKNYSNTLTARKAWFVFDDEVVALGSGITGFVDTTATETIVENKKIGGTNKLIVDGAEKIPAIGDTASVENAGWAWLQGNTADDATGYYFPGGAKLNLLRETRTSSWSAINGSSGVSTDPVTRNYLSLAIPHGEDQDKFTNEKIPASHKYENYNYVLLPGFSADETRAYAADPDIEILCNSTFVQAVRDNSAHVSGYVFWGDTGTTPLRVCEVEAVKGSVTIAKDPATHTMTVGMADVHQNNESLTFRVYGNDFEVVSKDEQVSAEIDKLGAVFTVNTAGSKGATFTVTLRYSDLSAALKAEMAEVRANYADTQTGNAMTNKTDAEYRAVMDKYMADAKEALDHYVADAKPGQNLFDDVDVQLDWFTKGNVNTDGSANLTTTTNRIKAMALAYTSEGCTGYYHDAALKEKIVHALDYVVHGGFPDITRFQNRVFANWWDWDIGVPKALTTAGVLMFDELDEALRQDLYEFLQILVPSETYCWMRSGTKPYLYKTTAANQAELAMTLALNALIGEDQSGLYKASGSLVNSLKYVTSGDGFYADGSYKQHGNFAYSGSYGVEMLRGVTQIASLTNNTTWACTDADPNIIYEWILNAFRPLYADGAVFDMVQGRSISRYNRSDWTTGRYAMDAILTLSINAPEEYRDALLSFVKTQAKLGIQYDPATYYGRLRFSSLIQAKNLLADDTIPLDNEVYTKVFGMMDKAAVHGNHFALAISMFSSRNGAVECGNSENLHGWYTSDGALSLYVGDQNQYVPNFWATVDPLRVAGITTNHVTKPLSNFSIKSNDRDWVGGSTVGVENYASIGMDFASNYSDLEAKKSWFAFGDQIVALGAGIKTTEGDTTETIVENRKLDNENTLLTNGSAALRAAEKAGAEAQTIDWAWLSANQLGSSIGYYFPETTEVNLLRETRTGTWKEINANGPEDEVSDEYLSIAIDHGANPTAAAYSYVLLPGKTAVETASYAEENTLKILSNTADLQAAADSALGVAGFNFWKAGEQAMPEGGALQSVASDAAASVTLYTQDDKIYLGISDPTQKQSTVNVTVKGADVKPGKLGEGVTAEQTADGVKLTVSVDGLKGATRTAQLTSKAQAALEQVAQAEKFFSGLTMNGYEDAKEMLDALKAMDTSALPEAMQQEITERIAALEEKLEEVAQAPARELLTKVEDYLGKDLTESDAEAGRALLEELKGVDTSLLPEALRKQLAEQITALEQKLEELGKEPVNPDVPTPPVTDNNRPAGGQTAATSPKTGIAAPNLVGTPVEPKDGRTPHAPAAVPEAPAGLPAAPVSGTNGMTLPLVIACTAVFAALAFAAVALLKKRGRDSK